MLTMKGHAAIQRFSVLLNLDQKDLGHERVACDQSDVAQRLLIARVPLEVIDFVQ